MSNHNCYKVEQRRLNDDSSNGNDDDKNGNNNGKGKDNFGPNLGICQYCSAVTATFVLNVLLNAIPVNKVDN